MSPCRRAVPQRRHAAGGTLAPMSTRATPEQIGELPKIGRPATAALLAADVTTLDGVAAMGEAELLALHGVGPRAIRILRAALEREGRSLGA